MSKKPQASPMPWRTSGAHKSNGEAVYILQDREQTPIGTVRSQGLPPETTRANLKLIENAPRMALILLETIEMCIANDIPVKPKLCEIVQDITGVDITNYPGITIQHDE